MDCCPSTTWLPAKETGLSTNKCNSPLTLMPINPRSTEPKAHTHCPQKHCHQPQQQLLPQPSPALTASSKCIWSNFAIPLLVVPSPIHPLPWQSFHQNTLAKIWCLLPMIPLLVVKSITFCWSVHISQIKNQHLLLQIKGIFEKFLFWGQEDVSIYHLYFNGMFELQQPLQGLFAKLLLVVCWIVQWKLGSKWAKRADSQLAHFTVGG